MNIVRLNKLLVLWAFSDHVTVVQQKNFTISEKRQKDETVQLKEKNESINPQLDKHLSSKHYTISSGQEQNLV